MEKVDWKILYAVIELCLVIVSLAIFDYLRKKGNALKKAPYSEKVIITAPRTAFTKDEWAAMEEKFYLVVPYRENASRPPDVRIL